jgi:ribA/ribD-fused uncharacterized protein
MNKTYHFFWKGILSNWTPSKFTHNGYQYSCGEQMMMHQKALLFKDFDIAEVIMLTENPALIKSLGREIKNFNQQIWDENKYRIVYEGLLNRYTQDEAAKDELLKYKDRIFVEASPFDRIWGIGYNSKDALNNIGTWGENLLGQILNDIVEQLK